MFGGRPSSILFFLDKFYERKIITTQYDYLINNAISNFIINGQKIKEDDLDNNSKKYTDIIELSVKNNLIKF